MLGKVTIANGNASRVKVGGAEKFDVTQQEALLHTSDGQVRKIKLNLEEGQQGYPVGEYTISDESLTVDAYGRVSLARNIKLVPMKQALSALPKAG